LSAGLVFVQEQIDGFVAIPQNKSRAYLGVPVLAAMPHETSGSLRLPRSPWLIIDLFSLPLNFID